MIRYSSVLILFGIALAGCGDVSVMCENEIVQVAAAQNGEYEAVLFQRDCGATTGFSSQVSIIKSGRKLKGGGNAFVADGNHGAAPAADWGGPRVAVYWQSADELRITYDGKARVFKRETRVNGVKVTYRTRTDW